MLRQSWYFSPILSTDKISDQVFPWAKYRKFPEKYVNFLRKILLMDWHTGWLTCCAGTPTPHSANSWLHSNGTL